jgi:hypothetical protein
VNRLIILITLFLPSIFASSKSSAIPYFDESQVPKDSDYGFKPQAFLAPEGLRAPGSPAETGLAVLRIGVRINLSTPGNETYSVGHIVKEFSGTPSFARRSRQRPKLGSYIGSLRDRSNGRVIAYDNIATGREYRRLTDEITFRFPLPLSDNYDFELIAENPESGEMELVFQKSLNLSTVKTISPALAGIEIREIKKSSSPKCELRMNIYAEGYTADRKEAFWRDAERTVSTFVQSGFPMVERLHFYAVFGASRERLGSAKDFGSERTSRDTFLNLFFPYWNKFGRWYDVVYPASEAHYRLAIGVAPHDYAFVLTDESTYWGIGNFRVLTGVPAHSSSFVYLLLHEVGHFFGLNEEYDHGGRTELEFAPGIKEPWSQNISFNPASPKWTKFIKRETPLPTPNSVWSSQPPVYGAYSGGYAQSAPLNRSHKPGFACVMDRTKEFCAVCRQGITDVMNFDLGLSDSN